MPTGEPLDRAFAANSARTLFQASSILGDRAEKATGTQDRGPQSDPRAASESNLSGTAVSGSCTIIGLWEDKKSNGRPQGRRPNREWLS